MNRPPAGQSPSAGAVKTAVIGFTGAGKTAAVRALGAGAVDLDATIELREGRSVAEIHAQEGATALHTLAEGVALQLLNDPSVHAVALGDVALDSERVRQALAAHRVVWLDVEVDDAWRRLWATGGDRAPASGDAQRFEHLHGEHQPRYEALANVVVPATRSLKLPQILESLAGLPERGTRVLWATTPSGDYPVYIGAGLVQELRFWPQTVAGRRVLVTDYNAGRHYGDAYSPLLADVRIMPGEQSKTVAHAEIVWTELVRHGVTRTDVVVALGGGVVGDLAGFCAATYQRGMRFVQVPTTLVAQVDSAYGGKTGIDLSEAKNYVGAFHQPSAVIADTTTLATLPPEELAAGYAEVIKTALIAGGALWEQLRAGVAPVDPQVIARCAQTKLRIVAQDEHDTGLRQLLNLGHTVGHAIETATGYARYRHGEAIGLGLLAELRLSGADALRAQVLEMLIEQGLPVKLEDVDVEQVIFHTAKDKKRVGEGPVPFVLCPAPGRPLIGQTVSPAELRSAIKELMT
jgi:shikimate kinase / 3-dehydroquinate synthase